MYMAYLSRLGLTDFSASMMIKNGPKAIKEFTSGVYNQFGMRVVVLAAYVDAEGDPATTM